MEPIPLSIQGAIETLNPSSLSEDLILVAAAGGASLLGAVVGAVAAIISSKMQIGSEHKREADNRGFAARREAFEAGMRLFHFIFIQRSNGVRIAPADKEAEQYDGYGTMGRLNLYASETLRQETAALAKMLDTPLLGAGKKEEIDREKNEIKAQMKKIADLMRSELGL